MVAAFWFAYVVTRPLGAASADYFGRARSLSGAWLGSGLIAVIATIAVAARVAHLVVTRRDVQAPLAPTDSRKGQEKTPDGPVRRGYR